MAKNRISTITIREDSDQYRQIVEQLENMIAAAKEFHGSWEQLHKQYLNQYLCRPEYKIKNTPWPNASNLFLPVGRVIQDGIMSNLHDAMFSNDPFIKVSGVEASDMRDAELLSQFYGEYVYKNLIPMKVLGNDWNFNTLLDGTGAVKPRWDRTRFLRREITAELQPIVRTVTSEILGVDARSEIIDGYEESLVESVKVESSERPNVDLVDLNNLFISPDTITGLQYPDCPWYFQSQNLTWNQLIERRRHGYGGIDDALKSRLGKRALSDQEREKRDFEKLASTTLDTLEVLEFYMRMVLPAEYEDDDLITKQSIGDEDGYQEEVVLTYFPATKTISRIVPLTRLYPDGRRPHIPNWFNRIPHMFYGQGVQSKAVMINRLINTSANQMIDGAHISLVPWFFYTPAMTGLLPEMNTLVPGKGIPVNDPRGINFPRFNTDLSQWLNIMQWGQAYAERDGSVSDFTIGRNPEKSAVKTARGTIALLQQGTLAFGRLASLMILAYEELFRAVHAQYKFRGPDELFFRVTGEKSPLRISRSMLNAAEVDFQFIINPDRQGEFQKNQMLFQFMTALPMIQTQPQAVRALAKQLYDSTGTKNFEEIWPEEMTQQIMMEQSQAKATTQPGAQFATTQIPEMLPAASEQPEISALEDFIAATLNDKEIGVKIQ